jgi:excisionase family DNA binding protein
MTPDHQQLIENTLQLAYARSLAWLGSMAIPQGTNPPVYTQGMMWNSPLGQDLQAIANSVEGYPVEDVGESLTRVSRILFGQTLDASDIRLPRDFHKTPLGQLLNDAYTRRYPADAWMRTSEVQKLFGVKRQTIYDWAEEGKLTAYHIKGTQMFRRKHVLRFHELWFKQKQKKLQTLKE